MHKQPRTLWRASALALLMAGGSSAALGATSAQELTDARHETQIWTAYALSPYLRANDLKVSVQNGRAILSGKVSEDVNRDLAKDIALGVSGIREVDNQIVVDDNFRPVKADGERSFGEVIDDASITSTIKSKLLWSKNADGLSTNVDTRLGRVTLTGNAQNASDRELVEQLASNTRGVVDVDNQITLGALQTVAARTEDEPIPTMSDGWITTKVKSTLMYSNNVSGTAIGVRTDGGVVSLTGNVSNAAEHARAVALAQNVRGVKSVEAQGLLF